MHSRLSFVLQTTKGLPIIKAIEIFLILGKHYQKNLAKQANNPQAPLPSSATLGDGRILNVQNHHLPFQIPSTLSVWGRITTSKYKQIIVQRNNLLIDIQINNRIPLAS